MATKSVLELRTYRCARHLVAMSVFRESAYTCHMRAKSHTLACIGYYYCAFHAALAALSVTMSVAPSVLTRVRHSTVRKLVEEHLKKRRLIRAQFMTDYLYLQEVREKANYQFSYAGPGFDFSELSPTLYARSANMLASVLPYVRERLSQMETLDMLARHIGDGIGDDLIARHAGEKVSNRVFDFLAKHQLST